MDCPSLSALPASLSAAWVVAGMPIRGRQSGSGGKKQVKSVLHPPTHESSPSRADSRKFQQDRGPRENPAKRFSWGEDERRNERAFGVSRKRGIWRLRGRGPAPNAKQADYIRRLVKGVNEHAAELDGYIAKYAKGWSFARIPLVASAIMRVSMYEMLYMPDIPNGAAINEAVEIAKKYETPETVKFINGILGSFVRQEVTE